MKLSNEAKVGLLALLALILFLLGFYFLKGSNIFKKTTRIYANYKNAMGLETSNAVMANGVEVGTVKSISTDKNMSKITVELEIKKDIEIPNNSIATIVSNPLGSNTVNIAFGNSTQYLKNKDTIQTDSSQSLLAKLGKQIDPIAAQLQTTLGDLDSAILSLDAILGPQNRSSLTQSLSNLNKITAALLVSTMNINRLLNTQDGYLAGILKNTQTFTNNLNQNNDKINRIVDNLDVTTQKFSKINMQQSIDTLNMVLSGLTATLSSINNSKGTVGKLLNDPTLYQNLAATANKVNTLVDDIRLHPKRYLSVSLIGGNKGAGAAPLTSPTPDTTNAPYIKVEKAVAP